MNNYNLVGCDTDSLLICKPDQSIWTKEEQDLFLKSLNDQFPEKIHFEHDGYYPSVIVAKAKNYILWDGKKLKVKGSAFKSATKSIALKEFMNELIQAMLNDKTNYVEIYEKYIKSLYLIKTQDDIKKWALKKTLTDKVLESERTNESKVRDALEGSEYTESDKFYVFYRSDDTLCLVENFNGDYNTKRLIKSLYDTTKTFETIIDRSMFINYSLKRNEKLLALLVNN